MTKKTLLFGIIIILGTILTTNCKKDKNKNDTVTDIDGNVYHIVTIGNQEWLVENLKTTKYRNGDPIQNVTVDTSWSNLSAGAYSNYNNNSSYADTYGHLYNWYAVNDSRKIAPDGWHVATDSEWNTLYTYLGGGNAARDKLKESGTAHWPSGNTGNNNSGFTALPGGDRDMDGTFKGVGLYSVFWSSSTSSHPLYEYIPNDNSFMTIVGFDIGRCGFSVRCIKD
ncbi:MAG: hypothetical protein A2X08_11435 [Bacteroidetes bacterium GWA2_32_17]|nr:MAG: hypothetical protein A2X08_11435 [Bacteroidetes bacterium GWA2_32_17]